MPVPFIDLRRFEPDFLDRWASRCAQLTAETRFVSPPEVGEIEEAIAERCGLAHGVACANGTDALQLALRAVGVGPGDRVLLPDATFWATYEAVVNCGGSPVTVDVDPGDLQMDFDLFVEAVAAHRPKAVLLVHLYGWGSARIGEFRTFCREHDLPLVEDGAQIFGSQLSQPAGDPVPFLAGAQVATLSFYPAKVLGACGDAGMVLCDDPQLATTLRQLGNHGRTSHYGYGLVGWNSRMGGFEAAYLTLSLGYFGPRLASRQRAAERYREQLAEPRFTEAGVETVAPPVGQIENGYLNVIRVDPERRPTIQDGLKARGIGTGIVYPGSLSRQPGAEGTLAGRLGGEHADQLCRSVLNLPLFAHITDDEVDEVVAALAGVLEV